MIYHAWTDGASRGNPGESGVGLIVRAEDGGTVLRECGYIGTATNNTAEYTALVTLLRRARRWTCTRLIVHSDSELVVRQLNGRYRVRDAGLRRYFEELRRLTDASPFPVEFRHIPREANGEADRLANEAIDSRKRLRA